MFNVGIVSVTNHDFGSILQTFALQAAVKKMGCNPQIVNYKESKIAKIKRFHNLEYAVSRLKIIYKQIIMNFVNSKQKKLLSERAHFFEKFIEKNLAFSKLCTNKEDLTELTKDFDVVLLGSDQVWHPMNLLMDFFTLTFVPDSTRKGAYAPSFGVSNIPVHYKKKYKKYIERINYVSSREITGVKLIKDLTGRDAPMVCDPTLLLTAKDWEDYLSNKVSYNEKYVFCYFIGNNPNQRQLVKEYARKEKLKIVALLHIDEYIASDEGYADYTPYNVGPSEFLYLIKNAECVMTDSFHASVFSLQFHKEFYTFNRFENGKGNSTSSRIDSLLETVKLQNRKVINGAKLDMLSDKKIDYCQVDHLLMKFRETSLEYLKSVLS